MCACVFKQVNNLRIDTGDGASYAVAVIIWLLYNGYLTYIAIL